MPGKRSIQIRTISGTDRTNPLQTTNQTQTVHPAPALNRPRAGKVSITAAVGTGGNYVATTQIDRTVPLRLETAHRLTPTAAVDTD